MKFTMLTDKAVKWRWKLTASNGEIVACSSQGFARKLDCQINCELTFDGLKQNKGNWHTYRGDE